MTDTHLFTDAGIPAGDVGTRFWQTIAEHLFDRAEEDGWDQPASLWAVLDPATTEAVTHVTGDDLARAGGFDPDGVAIGYAIGRIHIVDGHPRQDLPGKHAPSEAAAVVLLAEAWRSPTDVRPPSSDPDRIETRILSVVDASGDHHSFSRDRDTREITTIHGPVGHTRGRIVDLVARVLGVDVPVRVSLGEVLHRATLAMLDAQLTHAAVPRAQAADLAGPWALMLVAALLDGLDTPWHADADVPNLSHICQAGGVRGADALDGGAGTDQVVTDARALIAGGWDAFWTRPGANRWCYRDEAGALLTDDLWDWYGPGMRVELIDDALVDTIDAEADLRATIGPEAFAHVHELLDAVGWVPGTTEETGP